MRNVNDDAPVLFRTRWALSWLRGPLTLPEITRLMAARKAADAGEACGPARAAAQGLRAAGAAAGIEELFLAAKPGSGELVYRPRIAATAEFTTPTSRRASTAGRAAPGSRRSRTATARRTGPRPQPSRPSMR